MPLGKLSSTSRAIPAFAPPYTDRTNTFTQSNILQIKYRTSLAGVQDLVPDFLELAEEPLVTVTFCEYGMSTFGRYNEYIHQVEVTYNGETFDYCLSLILDNEAATFYGRETLGLPKTLGKVSFEPNTGSRFIVGQVERPVGYPVIRFSFVFYEQADPDGTLTSNPGSVTQVPDGKRVLNLRVIPSPIAGAPPSVRELVPCRQISKGGQVWLGNGSISFPDSLMYHPLHTVKVLRYESSAYLQGCSATIYHPEAVISI